MKEQLNVDQVVYQRYSKAAREQQTALCCASNVDSPYLKAIPREVLERDYGCGDPTPYVKPGEVVLDLGSGAGKACFVAAQIVGKEGRVIGIDMTPEMLEVARQAAPVVARNLGFANVEFRRARLEDLATDLDAVDEWLKANPVRSVRDLWRFDEFVARLRIECPLVADASVDVVISNCVLNLVKDSAKRRVFSEIMRVLRPGGRAIISDIVSDEPVPERLKRDPDLWSGCVSGALQEAEFVHAFEEAGFCGIEILNRSQEPWRTIDGIEFRSITVRALKRSDAPCVDRRQAVIYRGPWRQVEDDDGHLLVRGALTAVCEKTFRLYSQEPYAREVIPVEPREPVPLEGATPYDCSRPAIRSPREIKGVDYSLTSDPVPCCGSGNGCG